MSAETPKARHTTNKAFTISQTSNHSIIPMWRPPFATILQVVMIRLCACTAARPEEKSRRWVEISGGLHALLPAGCLTAVD